MRVLGVGSGAREHAIAKKLASSRHNPTICWIGELKNPGIHRICNESGGEYLLGKITDPERVANASTRLHVDFVFVGPEEPNFHGVPDELERRGIPCVGASRELAIIEMSKAELRRLQWERGIKGKLLFRTFSSADEAYAALDRYADTLTWLQNVALKPARQAGGKGVKVIEDRQIYLHDAKERFKRQHVGWLEDYMKSYSDIDDKILMEEKVWGPEYTLQCFTDGRSVRGMPLVQDYKNAHEFDIGTETGGMGSISSGSTLPFITMEEYLESLKIVESLVHAIQDKTGKEYRGVVAGQMMITEVEGPTVIEMYSRLGDPEALNVLATMKSDLVDVSFAIIDGRLRQMELEFEDKATVVKCLAPRGYPDFRNLAKGHPVLADEASIASLECELYWASADLRDAGRIESGGSRLVEILCKGGDLFEASSRIERAVPCVTLQDGWGLFHRSDIGTRELTERRIGQAERVRRLYMHRIEKRTLGRRVDWLPGIGKVDPTESMPRRAS